MIAVRSEASNFSQFGGTRNAIPNPEGPMAEAAVKVGLHDNKNVLSGLFFIGTGGIGIFMAQDYPMGTALRMDPATFPSCSPAC
jgi:hypothetical protein